MTSMPILSSATARPVTAIMLVSLIGAWSAVTIKAEGDSDSVESVVDSEEFSFNQDIRPILSDNCFFCHGPDEEHRQAGLRLDVAGEVDPDELLFRIGESDPDLVMPPPESHKTLSPKQIDLLTAWVESGAEYEQHWSFVPPRDVEVPRVGEQDWSDHPIDQFVLKRLRRKGWQPNGEADRRTLIRRLSLDLTGLPPTVNEVRQYLEDRTPEAYANLVDRLLESPRYGEHQARYWLDLVRFADTNGLHHDHYREMTPYRDWVIRSFNQNLPFDEFISAQVAGDLYEDPTVDQQIASGFNRLHLIIDVGTALPEESFTRNVVDRVSSIGTAFLGLTLECAVCHDHKYDPITQRDFYQMFAFFNNFDGEPETGRRNTLDFKRGLQPPYLEFPTPEQAAERERIEAAIDALEESLAEVKNQITRIEELAKEANDPEVNETDNRDPATASEVDSDAPQVDESNNNDANAARLADLKTQQSELKGRLKKRNAEYEKLLLSIPATLVMKERQEVRPAHLLIRGNYDQPGEVVPRDTPGFLPPMDAGEGLRTRLDLARWLVDDANPLTGRVAVNRFWQQLFGVGLVKTSEDFGAQGEPPSHPELLDYLTNRFVESGWDVKKLIRLIVMSETYRQSSEDQPERFVADPSNRWLSRGSRYRLDAEVIRDQILHVSGQLNPKLYGKSVKPPQPEGLWKIVAMPSSYPRIFEADTGGAIHRRSVYSFWKRGLPPPQMTIFDAPTREACVARRERTNTPLQALVLMNEEQYFAAAIHLAQRVLSQSEADDESRLRLAYETVTSHLPDDDTLKRLQLGLNAFRQLYRAEPEAANQLIGLANLSAGNAVDSTELAAWSMLAHSLFNLDVTRNRE